MKILVTGGAGFIASHIVDAYIADGHEVVIVDNLITGKRENLNPKAKFYEIDIRSPEVLAIFEKERPDLLNHHAAQMDVRKSVADPKYDLDMNVAGLINLMEAGRKTGLKKVVFASSGGAIYGEQEDLPSSEKTWPQPLSPYGITKLTSEHYLYYYAQVYGIPSVNLRYANVYGPRQNAHGEAGVVAIFLKLLLQQKQPIINGDGKQTRDYVFIGDVVEANRLALQPKMQGAYNVGTGIETDVNELFEMLCKALRIPCDAKHGPAKLGEQMRSCLTAQKIISECGWKSPILLENGLTHTAAWFQKNVNGVKT